MEGALQEQGMVSFAPILIRAFVVRQANLTAR
jgi:hypothetical protein